MAKLVVFSDLHGDKINLQRIIARAESVQAAHILCLGDLGLNRSREVAELIRNSPIPFLLVRGNCDSTWAFAEALLPLPPRYRSIMFEGRTIVMTHGDLFRFWDTCPVSLSPSDIFLYGHTHIAYLYHPFNGPWELNPGSASHPRDQRRCSYALITEEEMIVKEIESDLPLHGLYARF